MDLKWKVTIAAIALTAVLYIYSRSQNRTEQDRYKPKMDQDDQKHSDTIPLLHPEENDITIKQEKPPSPNIQIKQENIDSVIIQITNENKCNEHTIEYSQDKSNWKSVTISSDINEYSIKGLAPSTKYFIRAASSNNKQELESYSKAVSFETKSAHTIDVEPAVLGNETLDSDDQSPETKEDIPFSNDVLLDRSYGCVIGAAIGDSIGSYCEFRSRGIDEDELDEAMKMAGGGTWGKRVITGQVTDDTELAVSLAYGLIQIIGKSSEMKGLLSKENDSKQEEKASNTIFDLRPIGKKYRRWLDSHPFDIGICTRQTLRPSPDIAQMKQNADNYNKSKRRGNQANGALMRCMSLVLYGYKLDEDNLYTLMQEDASLTHANMGVYLTNTCYAIMIQYLLTAEPSNDKRNEEAFAEMILFLENVTTEEHDNKKGQTAQLLLDDWLEPFIKKRDIYTLNDLREATRSQGWVKIAFQRCCYHLLKGSGYKEAMRSVIGEGGDTDTNACIVGGLMGAYWGLKNIPKEYVDNIKNCNPTLDESRDKFQAKWYFQDKIPELLIKNAPTDDSFKIVDKY